MRTTSTPFKRAAYRSQTDEAILLLLEISHPELTEPIRITSDALDTPHGSAFLAAFSRASAATKLDGSQVANGVPRYEVGQYGQGIMIEEGTTNLVAGGNAEAGAFTALVVSVLHPTTGRLVKAIKLAAGENTPVSTVWGLSLLPNTDYTLTFDSWASDNSNAAVAVDLSPDTLPQTSFAPTIAVQQHQWVINSAHADMGNCTLRFFDDTGQPMSNDVYITNIQLAARAHATSFINGTRSAELLTIPTAGILTPSAGTVECRIKKPADTADSKIFGNYPACGAVNNILMAGYYGGNIYFELGSAAGVAWYGITPSTYDAEHDIALSWQSGLMSGYVDGTLVYSGAGFTPTFGDIFGIGGNTVANQLNGLVTSFRISNRARSAAEIAAAQGARLRIDADTTAWFGFDGSLNAAERYISYPFTLTLPDDRDDQINTAKLGIDNVDRSIVKTIRSLTSPPTVTVKIVLASTPDVIEAGPIPFTLTGVSWDALTVEGSLGFSDELLGQGYPAHAMTPQLFPGIFA